MMDDAHHIQPFLISTQSTTCLGQNWTKWLRSFNYMVKGKGIKSAEEKFALLLHLAGEEIQDLYDTFPTPSSSSKETVYENLVNLLNDYFLPKKNKTYERHVFRGMKQQSDSVDTFLTKLKTQANKCEFGSQLDENVREQLIEGCEDKELRRRILEKGDEADLQEIIRMAKSLETGRAHEKAFDSSGQSQEVNKLHCVNQERKQVTASQVKEEQRWQGYKRNSNKNYGQRTSQNSGNQLQNVQRCYRCNGTGHFAKSPTCPARNATCRKCNNRGHYAECCRTRSNPSRVNQIFTTGENEEEKENFVFNLTHKAIGAGNLVEIRLGGVKIEVLADSGANVNVVDTETWKYLKRQGIQCKSWKSDGMLYPYGHKDGLAVIGKFHTEVCHDQRKIEATFLVFEGNGQPILGLETAEKLGVMRLNVNTLETVNPKLYEGVGKLKNFKLKLHIDPTVTPVAQKCRPTPYQLREKIEKSLDKLLEMDIIEPVDEPSSWVSPIVPVPKKNGELRICVDMRVANQAIQRTRHPIPRIEELIDEMNNAKVFSKLDLKMGYHQIELEEGSREITTFITHKGLYRYKRLMFGMNSAPELYQHTLAQVLSDCEGVINYIDDVVVFGRNEEEHKQRLTKVLEKLEKCGLTLNKEKCQIHLREIEFLGFHISAEGVKPTDEKITAISKARKPKDASEMRSFLGLVSFCARFIPNLANKAEPLRRLTKKGEKFVWGKSQENAFENIKAQLTKAENLSFFDKDAETKLITDAGPYGLGAILIQKRDGKEQVVSYASRTLTDVERRYSQTEKEGLAVVWSCEHFQKYLIGKTFTLATDHKALLNIYAPTSKPSARMERWILRLLPYSFVMQYVKGDENIADSLSRLTVTETEIKHEAENYIYHVAVNATPASLTAK